MFKRTKNDLKQLVRIAWELGLSARHRNQGNDCAVMLDAVCAYLQATAWSVRKGAWKSNAAYPLITWTESRCSPLFPQISPDLLNCVQWCELIACATSQNSSVSLVIPIETAEHAESESQWRVLVRVGVFPDGNLEYVSFVKPAYATDFSELQRSLVDAMLSSHNGVLNEIPANDIEVLPKNGLSRRQREVLEFLLQGASLKEIAVGLKISRHTVNDYSKALYRHFEVSGRAELAAIFRHTSQLELSHAE